MPIQRIPEKYVQDLAKRTEYIASRVGDPNAREILSSRRRVARDLRDPEESRGSLELWQRVEKEIFGNVDLEPDEPDLTNPEVEE
jgi:hypothetical protein